MARFHDILPCLRKKAGRFRAHFPGAIPKTHASATGKDNLAPESIPDTTKSPRTEDPRPSQAPEQVSAPQQSEPERQAKPEQAPRPQTEPSSAAQEPLQPSKSTAEPVTQPDTKTVWDRAYAKLKESKPSLVAEYESLLTKELAGVDDKLKKEQLIDIAARGIERVDAKKVKYTIFGHEYVVKDQVAQASKVLNSFKTFIGEALKASPEASLAWAGVSVILPLFSNPSTADEAQSSGFDYVMSRMRLFVEFEKVLWPSNAQVTPELRRELEATLQDLYVNILTFQLTSVLRFYRGWLGKLGRDLVLYDDWKSMLESVKSSEVTVNNDFKKLHDASALRDLDKMAADADEQCESLRLLVSVAKSQLDVSKDLLTEAKYATKFAEANQPPLNLPTTYEARYDSSEVYSQPRCLPGTRKSVQQRITNWVNDKTGDNLFWLNGPAGTGKSTVSRTIAESFSKETRLAASYFFSRARQGNNELRLFFPTLASQLAEQFSWYKSLLREVLRDTTSEALVKKAPAMQFDLLVTGILQQTPLEEIDIAPQLIIVDALDECSQQNRVWELLKPLSKLQTICKFRICVLVTSRNVMAVDGFFNHLTLSNMPYQLLNLHEECSDESKADIESYLSQMFSNLGERAMVDLEPWPTAAQKETVLQLATTPSPLFIYAATLRRFLLETGRGRTPSGQLQKWLRHSHWGASRLSQMYLPVLEEAFQLTVNENDSGKFESEAEVGYRIIAVIILAVEPLSAVALAGLLDQKLEVVVAWLKSLRAVLDVREDVRAPVQLLHKSFSDFLLDSDNKTSGIFWIDDAASHEFIAIRCFSRMKRNGLRKNICGLDPADDPFVRETRTAVTRCIAEDLKYAAKYALHHMNITGKQVQNLGYMDEFFSAQFLYWLEAMSLLESIPRAIEGMATLVAAVSSLTGE